ncbi:hypothetical protein EDB86DRAFT_2971906 [Lactarius hatsudake]|nr:hypothetical protein EDB86DRAFT_2971906 [Lactarius hatsudake]
MCFKFHQLFVLSVITAATFPNFVTPLAPPWDDLRVKHTWGAVPANWETLGNPPAGTTIDLHVGLKSHNGSALIEALYEIWCTPLKGAGRSACRATQTPLSSSIPGLYTMVSRPRPSRRHTAAAG